jgi:hypothetical protein
MVDSTWDRFDFDYEDKDHGYIESITLGAPDVCMIVTDMRGLMLVGAGYHELERDGVRAVTVPEGVSVIFSDAFDGCKNLEQVTIPAGVKSILTEAFNDCGALRHVYYGGSQADWAAVSTAKGNAPLQNASIHCGYLGETGLSASAWAMDELREAETLGLIPESLRGVDLTLPITRAEFAAVSVKVYEALSGKKAPSATSNPFKDTADPAVLTASGLGITNGMSKTAFEPNRLLNREQAATMLARVFKLVTLQGWTLATDAEYADRFRALFTMPAAFGDDAYISSWARDSVYFMASKGIIKGMGDDAQGRPTFVPRDVTEAQQAAGYANATRQQALLIAVRMVKSLGR